MAELSIGQVILARFPFSDLSSAKLRPCLIVGLAEFDDVVLCQITSRRYSSRLAIGLKSTDFSHGSLVQDSYIRPDKLATLDKRIVHKQLGTINPAKLLQVQKTLRSVLHI